MVKSEIRPHNASCHRHYGTLRSFHLISSQAGLALFVMNACCNGPFTNRKLQKNERTCQQLCHIVVRGLIHQDRPYNDDSTASRLLSEVKHHLARLVLRWGTTLESLVLIFWFYFLFRHFELTIMSRALLSIILYH